VVSQVRLIVGLLAAFSAAAQTSADPARFRQAGVCARCHVAQVLEWTTSGHQAAAVDCQSCHGPSKGHVTDERNVVKPDKLPQGAAIAGLCQSCHSQGCPKTGRRDACQSCHHAHALFNPNENKELASLRFAEDDRLRQFEADLQEGERLAAAGNWGGARDRFQAALRLYPNHSRAAARLAMTRRRLSPAMPGFEILGDSFDAESGLPRHVRVAGMPIEMVLIPGGDADIGHPDLPAGRPVHTVALEPFYLARTELTQSVWAMLDAKDPSPRRGADLPVHNVSWEDAQQWIAQLNQRVPAGGFRLPSEAEWEHAARSAAVEGELSAVAWFRETSAQGQGSGGLRELDDYAPHPVATRKPDSRGIYDLRGNVWEWCSSLMKPYPYDAQDGRESPDAPGLRVLRGGGFADSADYLAPWFRHAERADRRLVFNGVRLARAAPKDD
jgi:formylglycine-generating enzyme required for sulfatase activity